MSKKKIILLMLLALIISVSIRNLDLRLRYNLNWFDYYEYDSGLTNKEQDYLKEKSLLVGVYNDPPLSFINEFNNDNAGIMVDYLSQLAIEISNNIHLKAGSREAMLEILGDEELDIIAIEKNDAYNLELDYTQPLCVVKGKVAIKSNSKIETIEDLRNHTLVALGNDTYDGRIHKYFEDKTDITIIEVDNMYQCLALVRNEIAVGFIGDDMEIAHYINVTNRGSNYRFLEDIIYEKEMCLAVKKDNEELLTILNKGILALKKKNLVIQTQSKWLGDFDSHGIDFSQLELAYKIVTAVIIIVAFFSSWNYVITQRVNTKTRELSESKAELRLIIDTLQRGIMVIENDSIIVECNDAIINLLKLTRDELIGKNHKQIEALSELLDENNVNKVFNYKDAYYYVTIQHYGNDKKLIMVEDYTEKHMTELRARQESKMIAVGQLSAGLAHEIRNPLGLIKSYGYVLEKYCTTDISKHALFVINDSVARINNLIENLLGFSKLSNDETKLTNIKNLIDLILALEEKHLEEHDINIECKVHGKNIRPVVMNEDVFKMIMLNLINNGIDSFLKLDREEKLIHIDVEINEMDIKLKISDNGCGIEKDKLENIFNPFYSTKDSGTGLGLYIISTEIANNDGNISVDSEYGKGTEFNITLPIKE